MMRIRIRTGSRSRSSPENIQDSTLLKLAGLSAVGHVVVFIAFVLAPRLAPSPPPPRELIADIIPASSLLGPPAPRTAPRTGPTPSERAETAKRARETPPPEPEPPKPEKKPEPPKPAPPKKDPELPPLEPPAEKDKATEPAAAETPEVPPEPRETVEPEPVRGDESPTTPPAGAGQAGPEDGGVSLGPENPSGGGLSGIPMLGSSAFPYDYYRSSLITLLQTNWRKPAAPEGLGEPLRCRVAFTINKNGLVQNTTVSEPSGNSALDRSALRAVIDSNPFPPLPYQYGQSAIGVEVVFELTSE